MTYFQFYPTGKEKTEGAEERVNIHLFIALYFGWILIQLNESFSFFLNFGSLSVMGQSSPFYCHVASYSEKNILQNTAYVKRTYSVLAQPGQ